MKTLLLALFVALPVAAAPLKTLRLQEAQQSDKGLRAEIVEVQTHRNAGYVIAQDALYGGIAGLAIGAGAGLLIGGIFGAVDAAASADRAYPAGEMRDIGFSRGVKPIGGKF